MLRKLLKYELKGTARYFLPLFAAIVLLSALNRMFGGVYGQGMRWINGLLIFIEVILIIGLAVMVFVITILRFYKNLLGNEGYLMFTLPVSARHNILSKLIAAMMWNIGALLTIALSVTIMSWRAADIAPLINFLWQNLVRVLRMQNIHVALMLVGWAIVCLISVTGSILSLYLAMSIGQLANNHKFLASFGAYLGIQSITSVLTSAIGSIITALPAEWLSGITLWFHSLSVAAIARLATLGVAAAAIVGCVVYYLITLWLLEHKLNLT